MHVTLRPQHAHREALVDGVGFDIIHRIQQPRFDARADNRRRLQDRPRRGGEARDAGQDGVLHRRRDALLTVGENFGHEERIASGAAVEGSRVHSTAGCQRLYRRSQTGGAASCGERRPRWQGLL